MKRFLGQEISKYGIEQGYVDYGALSNAFPHILNNQIICYNIDDWEIINGADYIEEEDECCFVDIFQYYIINEYGYEILKDFTNEIVYYNEELDIYLWGVTHYGTSWDYVLTDIKIGKDGYYRI